MQNDQSHLIYSFPKSENEQIHLVLRRYKDRYYVDMRTWYQVEGAGAPKPTQKGICFPADLIGKLKEGISELIGACEKLEKAPPAAPKQAAPYTKRYR